MNRPALVARTWEGWIPDSWPVMLSNGDETGTCPEDAAACWAWEKETRTELGGPLAFEYGERDDWRTFPRWMGGDGPAVYVVATALVEPGSGAELDALVAELDALP